MNVFHLAETLDLSLKKLKIISQAKYLCNLGKLLVHLHHQMAFDISTTRKIKSYSSVFIRFDHY